MSIDFCLPIYNEEKILDKNIRTLLEYLNARNFDFAWKIILINNGSTDNTAAICAKLKSDRVLVESLDKSGKGLALRTYFTKTEADAIVYMDIDLAVSLDSLPDLIEAISQGYDLAVGSRLLAESQTTRSFKREVSSRIFNLLSRLILRHNFSDSQCGFKALKKSLFSAVCPHLRDDRWFFDTELIVSAHRLGYKIKEIPVAWEENRYDKRASKVNVALDSFIFLACLAKLSLRLRGLRPE